MRVRILGATSGSTLGVFATHVDSRRLAVHNFKSLSMKTPFRRGPVLSGQWAPSCRSGPGRYGPHIPPSRFGRAFPRLWERETSAPDVFQFLAKCAELPPEEKAEICVIDQLHRWPAGLGIPVERYFESVPDIGSDDQLRLRLVVVEFRSRQALRGGPELDNFLCRFPDLCDSLCKVLAPPPANGGSQAGVAPTKTQPSTDRPSPGVPTQMDSRNQDFLASFVVAPLVASSLPTKIGRYQVLRILGDGGFGRVYLAYDDVLRRQVAIKVPHAYRIAGPADVETYLKEVRLVARLDDHAMAVVPVYDCGQTEDGLCYVVSKYIEGSDLATKVKRTPLTLSAAAELVAKVAEALHAAHLHGVVHRDVKPANILIDLNDRPFLADFGIALKEEDYGTGDRTVGTVSYMSPEQLRGEGHLVDGRSDIFSLGVVLYELICGRRAFLPIGWHKSLWWRHDLLARSTTRFPRSWNGFASRLCPTASAIAIARLWIWRRIAMSSSRSAAGRTAQRRSWVLRAVRASWRPVGNWRQRERYPSCPKG